MRTLLNTLATLLMMLIGILLIPLVLLIVFLLAPAYWYRYVTGRHPRHWLRVKLGRGKSVDELAQWLGVTSARLMALRPNYRRHVIAKRSGGKRQLWIPSDTTKSMQRRILHRVLAGLRAHSAASAYENEKSIVDNAAPHVGQSVVIKLDVVDFFPSTTSSRVLAYFQRVGWDREAAELLTRLTTHEGGLPQGAPTSPRLSNLVNFGVDVRLQNLAERRGARCTRYADDITFSLRGDSPRRIRGLIQSTRRILKAHGYELHLGKKLRVLRQHQRQMVTGLVVNAKLNLPRSKRRKLRAVAHRLEQGRNATMTPEQLAGYDGLQRMITGEIS